MKQSVLAFFGSDVTHDAGPGFLRRSAREGVTLLPLDSHAAYIAGQSGADYVFPEDIVPATVMSAAIEEADYCAEQWYRDARELFTVDGNCWPELDHSQLLPAWRDSMLAIELANMLEQQGFVRMEYFGHIVRHPKVGFGPSDIANTVWNSAFGGETQERRLSSHLGLDDVSKGFRRLASRIRAASSSKSHVRTHKTDIVMVITPSEVHRFSHVISALEKGCPGKLRIILSSGTVDVMEVLERRFPVPVTVGPGGPPAPMGWVALSHRLSNIDSSVRSKLCEAYNKALSLGRSKPWRRPMELLSYQFMYLCRFRWPYLHKRCYRRWFDIFSSIRPEAVVVSSLEGGETASAVKAARRVGSAVLSLPHGGVEVILSKPTNDRLFSYSLPIQKTTLLKRGVDPERIYRVRSLVAPSEYPVSHYEMPDRSGKARILVISHATYYHLRDGRNLDKKTSLRAQYDAFRALSSPPSSLSSRIDLRIKVHPVAHDMEMIKAADSRLSDCILPLDSDLKTAISSTKLAIAVNYFGTALIHILKAGVPVIYFLTENENLMQTRRLPFDIFDRGVTTVRTAGNLWNLVEEVLDNELTAVKMSTRSREFAREYLADDRAPGVDEVIRLAAEGEYRPVYWQAEQK